MTALRDILLRMIDVEGPLPVSTYMTLCLHHAEHGYYATRPGLGRDFSTAPELSQVFGDLVGAWTADTWQKLGSPDPFILAELGPGRATMIEDALRATRPLTAFQSALRLHLIEASPALRAIQAERLAGHAPIHLDEPSQLPEGPTILLANEYLDCLPARQFVRDGDTWRERLIGRGTDNLLALGVSANTAEPAELQLSAAKADLVEVQPGLDTLVAQMAELAARDAPLIALFIDYGPDHGAPADTLRAYRGGEQVDPLQAPGKCDLTVDVDFGRLSRLAAKAGLTVHGPIEQGPFLLALGAEERLNRLAQSASDGGATLFEGTKRLVDPNDMGSRFKVLCISNMETFSPAGFPETS